MQVGPVLARSSPGGLGYRPPRRPCGAAAAGHRGQTCRCRATAGRLWRTGTRRDHGTALARLDDGRLLGLALVHTALQPRTDRQRMSRAAAPVRDGFAVIRYDTLLDGFCAYGRLQAAAAPEPLWDEAIDALVRAM